MNGFRIKSIGSEYYSWVADVLTEKWGSTIIVTRGKIYHADKLPGFIALVDNKPAGLITYNISENDCEIISLNSFVEKRGIGSSLIQYVENIACQKDCKRLWLVTTNDNIYAFRFYQKRGFRVAAYHLNAIEESRKLKPEIPQQGIDGINISDEIELEMFI